MLPVVNGRKVQATKSGLRVGNAKAAPAAEVVAPMSKSDRRKVRKGLRELGRHDLLKETLKAA